ncbi:MAG: ComEC/Rec2 family competence protein, partial [Acidobacteriaceae bacterium]|nr:ComEC/Rec2 family competence protein [Acidobacteriaceae bacterium]
MLREPLLLPAAALAVGIVIGHLHSFPPVGLIISLAFASALIFFSFLLQRCVHWRPLLILVLFSIAGIFTQTLHRNTRNPKLNAEDGETVLVSGCVSNPPVFSPDREQFTLDLAPQTSARISVNLKNNAKLPLRYGQSVEVTAKIRSPRNFGNPDAFDYVAYLAGQHIYWTGSVSGPTDIHVIPGRCGSRAVALLYDVRTWALERLQALYPGDQHTASLLQATLLGETGGVEKRWTSDFRVTGTYHALVISGQHVSVLALTLLFLLRLLQFRRVPALCVATIASWLYAFISGFSSPVVRAAGGFTLFLIASYCFRKTRILNVLAAVALIYLLFDPAQLFDPSFQLSFLSAAAIAAFAVPVIERFTEPLRGAVKRFDQIAYDPQIEERAAQWRVELRLLARTVRAWTGLSEKATNLLFPKCVAMAATVLEAVIVSACVQFGLALPMVAYFHRLSITGLSANILIIPLLSAVVPLGFASMLTMWHPLAFLTKLLLGWAEGVASWHVQFEPSWRIAAVPLPISLAFAAALIALAWTIRLHSRYLVIPLTCSLALFTALCWQPWKPQLHPHRLEVTAIDVGQGDSIFLAFPDGTTMLVDAGGFPGFTNMAHKPQLEFGEDVISPYLWSRRIRHIDYAVLTHGHSDHMGG